MKTKKSKLFLILSVWLAIILLFVSVFFVLDQVSKREDYYKPSSFLTIDGVDYREKNLETLLLVGIDEFGQIESSDSYNNTKQADFVALFVFEKRTKTCTLLHFNRDSMVDIDVLGVTGERTGITVNKQLALSHTYGDGLKGSAMNTRRAVSRMLYGVTIDHYITATMDAVKIFTDYLGGIPVTMEKDYTQIDPAFQEGKTVFLSGEQALSFVRARSYVEDSTNLSRMVRQKSFIKGATETLRKQDSSIAEGLFRALNADKTEESYILTDCSVQDLSDFLELFTACDCKSVISPKGTADYSGQYVEFFLDEQDLKEIVVKTFLER